jgi:hypothetical protein
MEQMASGVATLPNGQQIFYSTAGQQVTMDTMTSQHQQQQQQALNSILHLQPVSAGTQTAESTLVRPS